MIDRKLYHLCFPGGKTRALTLSYDDGVIQDRRLVEILNRSGLKCTFNLGSAVLGYQGSAVIDNIPVDVSKVLPEEVPGLYRGHEIAGHGLYHSDLTGLDNPAAVYELVEDKRRLEELTGTLVTSFAYPFGTHDGRIHGLLKAAGLLCARTVESTESFALPEDFLRWNPTCHHNNPKLDKLLDAFLAPGFFPKLFYLWGHAYEFDQYENWEVIERFAARAAEHSEDIWFATNGELYRYITAYRGLRFSADGRIIENPSACDVWLGNMNLCRCIPAGKTIKIDWEEDEC